MAGRYRAPKRYVSQDGCAMTSGMAVVRRDDEIKAIYSAIGGCRWTKALTLILENPPESLKEIPEELVWASGDDLEPRSVVKYKGMWDACKELDIAVGTAAPWYVYLKLPDGTIVESPNL